MLCMLILPDMSCKSNKNSMNGLHMYLVFDFTLIKFTENTTHKLVVLKYISVSLNEKCFMQ